MQKGIECTISGKNLDYEDLVWVKDLAFRLGLKGITFFKSDGSIKVTAEGEEDYLLFFIQKLRRGPHFLPLFSPIENFSVVWHEPKNEFKDFSISEIE